MRTHLYRISVAGHLGCLGREAFAGMEIVCANGRTDLFGELDQAALFGLLGRVQALALELLEVRREAEPVGSSRSAQSAVRQSRGTLAQEDKAS